ncbi:MAG: glycosyltransferase [Sandaracinus sp.]
MPAAPTLSVLLPFRDVEPTLDEAIGSVLAEREIPIELVAIDDGSRDGSRAIAEQHAAHDPRVRVITGPARGIALALRAGLEACRAPLVARMDGDDVSLPGRFGAQCALLASRPSLAVVGTRVEAFASEGELGAGLARYVAWQNALLSPEDHAREVFVEAPLCHPSVVMRRDALDAIGGYRDGDFPEDYDLWLRFALAGHAMAKTEHVGLRWRHRAGRLTFASPRYTVDRIRAIKAEHLATRIGREASRALVVWGAGPFGRRLARALEAHSIRTSAFIDIDPDKIGRVARGAPIVDETALDPTRHFVVFAVGSPGARDLVRAALGARRFVEGQDFVCAA